MPLDPASCCQGATRCAPCRRQPAGRPAQRPVRSSTWPARYPFAWRRRGRPDYSCRHASTPHPTLRDPSRLAGPRAGIRHPGRTGRSRASAPRASSHALEHRHLQPPGLAVAGAGTRLPGPRGYRTGSDARRGRLHGRAARHRRGLRPGLWRCEFAHRGGRPPPGCGAARRVHDVQCLALLRGGPCGRAAAPAAGPGRSPTHSLCSPETVEQERHTSP